MKLDIKVKKIRDNLYVASCPDFPGCHIQANSERNAILRIREAIKLMVVSYKQHFEKTPFEG